MSDVGDEDAVDGQRLSQPRWNGAQSIRMAHELNGQFIDLFCDLSTEASPEEPWPLLSSHRDLWRRLGSRARRRLAIFPFVIVDLRFGDERWWRSVSRQRANRHQEASGPNGMPSTRRECLALETLMFAWQAAREDLSVAQMVFAMVPAVADCIAALTTQQVRTTAVENTRFLRMRWDNEPKFWRELLTCALEAGEAEMEALRREAKLRFCGEIIDARSSPASGANSEPLDTEAQSGTFRAR